MRPGEGEKSRPGSSALRRTSMAWPRGGGGSPSSVPPAATWSCSRTRSAPVTASVTGCSTWRRVLTSMKENLPLVGLVEELDGGGALVAGLEREPRRRTRRARAPARREHRAGGLLDDLLVAALVAAVAHAERPHAALRRRPSAGPRRGARRRRGAPSARSGRRTPTRPRRGRARSPARAPRTLSTRRMPRPPPPAAALIMSGKPSSSPTLLRLLGGLDRAAAPGRDRHAGLLGQLLALDLVAELAHDVGARADERDAELLAQLGEGGVLGHEAPADPGDVGLGLDQRALEALVVEVGGLDLPSSP